MAAKQLPKCAALLKLDMPLVEYAFQLIGSMLHIHANEIGNKKPHALFVLTHYTPYL